MKDKRGFTLVELLAVIIILAIIIAIATPAFGAIQKNVNQKQYENKIELIKVAALKYADDTNYVAFYVDDLVKNGYLEADKKVGEDYQVIDNRDGSTIMNCYIINITETMDQNYAEVIDKDSPAYKSGSCPSNLPNNANNYFNVKIYEDTNDNYRGTNTFYELTYDKYHQWWTKHNVKIEVQQKNEHPISSYEWYKGTENSSNKLDATSSNYYVSVNDGAVLQQNYIIKVKLADGKEIKSVVRVYIDKIRPAFYTNNGKIPTDWVKSIELNILGYDNESGLSGYRLLDSSETTCPTDESKYKQVKKHKITANGTYRMCLRDNVGNVSENPDEVKIENVDNSNIECEVTISGTKGNTYLNNQWYIGNGPTLTVKPTDVGKSGIYLELNNESSKEWKNTWTSAYYFTKDTFDSYNDTVKKELSLGTDTSSSGTIYYGHTKNGVTTNICKNSIFYESDIKNLSYNASSTSSTQSSISAAFTAPTAASGINNTKTKCYRTTSNGVNRTRITGGEGTVSGNNCNFTVPETQNNTTYYFEKCVESNAGNSKCVTGSKENVGYCNSTKWKYGNYGTCNVTSGTPTCGSGTQTRTATCVSTYNESLTCPDAKCSGTPVTSQTCTVNTGCSTNTCSWKEPSCPTISSSYTVDPSAFCTSNKIKGTVTRDYTCTNSSGSSCNTCSGTKPTKTCTKDFSCSSYSKSVQAKDNTGSGAGNNYQASVIASNFNLKDYSYFFAKSDINGGTAVSSMVPSCKVVYILPDNTGTQVTLFNYPGNGSAYTTSSWSFDWKKMTLPTKTDGGASLTNAQKTGGSLEIWAMRSGGSHHVNCSAYLKFVK